LKIENGTWKRVKSKEKRGALTQRAQRRSTEHTEKEPGGLGGGGSSLPVINLGGFLYRAS
jgi:hypothetical protein